MVDSKKYGTLRHFGTAHNSQKQTEGEQTNVENYHSLFAFSNNVTSHNIEYPQKNKTLTLEIKQ